MSRNGPPRQYKHDPKTEQFRRICEQWSSRIKVSPNAIFHFATEYGRTYHWMRERWLGGTPVVEDDLDWLRMTAGRKFSSGSVVSPGERMHQSFKLYRDSIEKMCGGCMAVSKVDYCPDSGCALRPVSLAPLRPVRVPTNIKRR